MVARNKRKVTKRRKKNNPVKRDRLCITKGYAYRCDGDNWRTCGPDYWELILVEETKPAKFVGRRKIDGADLMVFKHGSYYYAQSSAAVKRC